MYGVALMAGVNFATNFLSGLNSSNLAKAEARQYYLTAQTYRKNAGRIRFAGAINEDVMRAKNRANIAGVRAGLAEAGMGESPTMTSVLATTASGLEQNVLNARYETESDAENYLYQARMAEANAGAVKKNGRNKFVSSLILGGSSGISTYFNPMKTSV